MGTIESFDLPEEESTAGQTELINLWGKYVAYRESNQEKWLTFQNAIAEHWWMRNEDVDIDKLEKATQRLMIVDFGLSLAEAEYPHLSKLLLPVELVIVDRTDNNFCFSVVRKNKHLSYLADIESLLSDTTLSDEEEFGGFGGFVFLLSMAYGEFGHMLFFSIKSEKVRKEDHKMRKKIERQIFEMEDEYQADVLYHTIGSEYRGRIWEGKFFRTHLPSWDHEDVLIRESGRLRRLALT